MDNVIDLKTYREYLDELDIFVSFLVERYESDYFEPPEDDD